MDMSSLITTLLSSDSVSGVSKATKVSSSNVQSVLNAALPLLLNGAKAQSEDESTAESFASALLEHYPNITFDETQFHLIEATDRIMAAVVAIVEELRQAEAPPERYDPHRSGVKEIGNPTKQKRTRRKKDRA